MTPITDMVTEMAAKGAPIDAIIVAIRAFELSRNVPGHVPGHVPDNGDNYERDRKRAWRANINKISGSPEANDAGATATMSRDMSRNVPDNGDNRCDLSSLLSSSEPLQEATEEVKKGKGTEQVEGHRRGTRLTEDWRPDETDRQFARDHGVDADQLRGEFIDFWIAVPGQRGTKLNWSATWRNRVRAVQSYRKGKPHGQNEVLAAADRLIERVRQFDEPAPAEPGKLRGGTRALAVRSIPEG